MVNVFGMCFQATVRNQSVCKHSNVFDSVNDFALCQLVHAVYVKVRFLYNMSMFTAALKYMVQNLRSLFPKPRTAFFLVWNSS